MNITDYTLSPAVSGTARTSGGDIPYRFTFETARFTGGAEITAFCYLKEGSAPGRPVLFATGFQDTICPPVTQYAVYNRITSPKRHLLYPDFAHEEIQEFDDRLIRFFCCQGPDLWEEEEYV